MKVLLGTTNPSKVNRFSNLLKDCEIELQLVYHKHYGLFGVEAEAIESCASDIVSPYSGENAESIIEEE